MKQSRAGSTRRLLIALFLYPVSVPTCLRPFIHHEACQDWGQHCWCTGLRPSELLGLVREYVFVPYNPSERISLRLGVDHSTKVKREQFVQVDPKIFPHAYKLIKLLHAATSDRGKLFPFSYSAYSSFQLAEKHFELKLGLTAHSGRAGFATSRIMSGADAKQVQAEGRWRSDTSFRCRCSGQLSRQDTSGSW